MVLINCIVTRLASPGPLCLHYMHAISCSVITEQKGYNFMCSFSCVLAQPSSPAVLILKWQLLPSKVSEMCYLWPSVPASPP